MMKNPLFMVVVVLHKKNAALVCAGVDVMLFLHIINEKIGEKNWRFRLKIQL
jgi:hypothetical protein